MIAPTMIMRPARRAASAGALTARLRRNQSACAMSGQSLSHHTHDHDGEEATGGKFLGRFQRDSSFREDMVYSLSHAGSSLESDLDSDNLISLRMRRQLKNSHEALISTENGDQELPPQLSLGGERIERKLPPLEQAAETASTKCYLNPLPTSIDQISPYMLDGDARAIVITDTKSPYTIVAVNSAWESLCGYSREECRGSSLGSLLQGPDTDMSKVTALTSRLLAGEQAGEILTNYSKKGRKFQNNIRVGPIEDEMGKTVNFVGVLQEVNDEQEQLLNKFSVKGRMQLPFMS